MKRYIFLIVVFLSFISGRAMGQCTMEGGSGLADQTVCDGTAIDPIMYSATGATEVSTITLPAGLTSSFTAPIVTIEGTPTETGAYSVTLSDGTSDLCTSTGNITVDPLLPVSVSIAASANPVCDGTSVTFTPTPVNGGTPTYEWYKNSVLAGTGSTYTYTPSNGDQVYVIMTSSETCTSGSPATSNTITMTVNPVLAASVTIGASANPVCDGTSVTFTPTPVNGGTPTYEWYKNSTLAGTGSTYTYTPSNGDQVYVVMTSSETCTSGSPATSNTITMTVNSNLPVSVSIAVSANPVCDGTSVTFTPTPVNGGTPTYEWYKNSVLAGTGSTYTYTPSNGDQVYVIMTSSETCTSGNPATSNTISMTVNPNLPVSVSIVASDNNICTGTAVTFTATPVNGGASPSYQWYRGSIPVGTDSDTYTYNPSNNHVITVVLSSSEVCTTGSPATSNAITMTVYTSPPATPGTIAGSSNVCQGQTGVVYSIAEVTNALSYEWSSGGGSTVVSGQGTTDAVFNFDPGASNHSIYVRSVNTCGSSSNRSKSITVRPTPNATIDVGGSSETTVCQNAASPQIVFHNPQSPTDIVITYNINGTDQTNITLTGSTASVPAPTTTPGTFIYSLVSVKYEDGTECSTNITGTATVNVTPTVGTPVPITISSGSDPVCQLTDGVTNTTYTTTANNSTGFNWSLSNGSAGSIGASTGIMTWANGFSGSVDIRVTASGCNGPSPQVIRTVNITPTVGTPTLITVSGGTEPTCVLTSGTTTTTYSTTATNSTGFNWSLSNSAAGTIDPVTGVMTWTNGFSGSVNIQVTANGCNGPSAQVIRTVNITPAVGNPTPITVSAGVEPTCQLTNGTTTTTYATTATNNLGFNWSLSDPLAGSIDPSTGVMTWTDGFSGSVDIQVYAIGCSGNSPQITRTVNITPTVGTPTPITLSGGSDPVCQLTGGTTMTIYSTTATNSTGFNWSLSNGAAGSIDPSSGLMTWVNGFSGSVDIRVTANGCNGPSPQVIRTVTVNPLPVITITGPAAPRITSSGNIYETEAGMSGYTWSVSGGGSGSSITGTISVTWNTTGNQTVSVNYTDTHGCSAVSPTIYSVDVKTIPSATNAQISGYPAAGNTLTGTYTYTDGSTGTDNSTFRWLRNGTDPIPSATGTTYVPTMDDINKTLTFEVTPVSSVGPPYSGTIITSSPTEPVEDLTGLPVADEVCIEGIRNAGNTISGEYRYTFSKPEGVSTYRWLRRDTASGTDVVVGTSRQYTLVAEDIDDTKDIIFEVTPVSSNLTPIAGDPVQSRPLAKIFLPKTEYSVSEPDVVLSTNEPGGVFSGTGVTGFIFSPSSAGSDGSPYTLTYLLNIVNTSSSCSQQASKIVIVNPNVTSFVGVDPFYCQDGVPDLITVTGVPTDATERDFSLTDSDAIISETGTSVTIDPGKMRPGMNVDTLYYSYKRLGTFYRINTPLVVDSVGTEIRLFNLDTAYCQGDARQYVSVEGVYPAGGTADWSGVILSDTKPASAFADPSLGIPDVKYPISYQYKSTIGCYSKILRDTVIIYPLPDPSFPLNATYNIEGGSVDLIPVQPGGTFSGNGVSGDKMFPDIAGLGEHEIRYIITDANGCTAELGKKTTVRQAQGSFSGIASVICYSDTTYAINVTGLPTGVIVTGFTNTKNTLVYTMGDTNADYNVAAAGEGLDTLNFFYKWDGVDYSISKALNIDSLGQATIELTPDQKICDNDGFIKLYESPAGGVFTGPVVGGYLDPTIELGPLEITYTYTNIKTGCSISTKVPVTIYPAPEIAFAPLDVCIESGSDTTFFSNNTTSEDTVEKWLWEFTDITGISQDSLHEETGYPYKTGGLHKIALTAITVNGCDAKKELTFNFGVRPDADFYWRSDCMHPDDSIILIDNTESESPISSRSWRINETEFSTSATEAKYPKYDTGYIQIQYIVRTNIENCIDTVTKDIFIRPTVQIMADDSYFENFESGNGGWVKGELTGNTWSFGLPDRGDMDNVNSGQNAWYTNFNMTEPEKESSSIMSPCFDFTATERPEIKLMLMKRFTRDSDGASLQYRIGDNNNWRNVGAIDDGIEWYNSAVIRGAPGGNQLGWTTRGEPDSQWIESIHTLDELRGETDVVFRIAYGSDGMTLDTEGHEGLAFDDIWIGERGRNILIEHFTNINDPTTASKTANSLVNTIISNRSEDVINIQYHTNFPGSDQYYDENPADIGARILFYGLSQAPYTFVDGGSQNDFAYIYSYIGGNAIDSNEVTKRSLIPSLFDITVNTEIESIDMNEVLKINGTLKALEKIDSLNLTLFIAVTEKKSTRYTGLTGETEFNNVFRKFIPDAGGILLQKSWNKGDSLTITEQSWKLKLPEENSDIEVIAFIQNTLTKEIYQASSVLHHDITVGIEDTPGIQGRGFRLYPNPAVNRLTIGFEEALSHKAVIQVYDMRGVVVSTFNAEPGVSQYIIDDLSLKGGIYLVRIISGIEDFGYQKLVITGD